MLQSVFIQWNIAVRKMNQSTFIILNEMTTNITLHEKIKLEKQWHVLFMVTDLCGKHVKSSMIKIIIEFRVVVTPGEGNGWGRHTESLNNICNVYFFEIRRRMKIQLVSDQTICGYTGVCYLLHTFFGARDLLWNQINIQFKNILLPSELISYQSDDFCDQWEFL